MARSTHLAAMFAAAAMLAEGVALAAAPSTELQQVMSRLRVQEAPDPIRENPRWRPPRKVLLLAWGNAAWNGRLPQLQAAVPGVRVVAATDRRTALAEAVDADAIVGYNPDICDPELLGAARELRWVQSLAAGVELCMKVPAIRQPDLLMTNMRGVDSPAIAEHAVAMMLALAHGLDVFALDTSRAIWSRDQAARTRVIMLEGKTLLVVGLGGIGTEVARRAAALGMKVVATDVSQDGKPDFVSHLGRPEELLTLARDADVVINCVPLTPQTTGMYDARFFQAIKRGALFLNVARGPSVVTDELLKALTDGRLGGAGLDVVDPEPLPPDHPLWKAPRVLMTPHISARNDLPGDARWVLLAENLRRYAAGERMLQVVDVQRGY